MEPRENAYILLGLDPDRDTEWTVIEPVLKRKKTEWSMPHPTRAPEYTMYRSWVADMERVLKDPELRKEEAKEARKKLAKQRAELMANLDTGLGVTGAKGYLTEQDVRTLAMHGTGKWTEKEVRDRAGRRGLRIQPAPSVQTPSKPRMDEAAEKPILANLKTAGLADLYALLDAPATTSTAELRRKADKKYHDMRTHGDKSKADYRAKYNLLSECLKIFASDADREKYDNTMTWRKAAAELEALVETAGKGEGRLRVAVVDELMRQGKKLAMNEDEVIATVIEVAARHTWPIAEPSTPSSASLVVCGHCGETGPGSGKSCPICGEPYQVPCPKCKAVNPSGARVCGNMACRFEVGKMSLGERLLRSAKGFRKDAPARAIELVEEALRYWPGHPEATALKAELDRQEAETHTLHDKVVKAITKRNFEAANRDLAALASKAPAHAELGALRRKIDDALAEAARYVAKALKHARGSDEAMESYCLALAVCEDFQAARDGLSRCPPAPPTDLRLTASTTSIALVWNPSLSRGQIAYRVVRKAGSDPMSPDDGEPLGSPRAPQFTDTSAEPGKVFCYAVFAERGGTLSHKSAIARPEIRTAEVTDLKARPGDQVVILEWTIPPRASGVEVWRTTGTEPRQRGDGTRVANCSRTSAHDSGLTNGTAYGYRVIAIFSGPNGPSATEGITRLVTPIKPPPAVTDLKVAIREGQFQATWSSPASGQEVQILRLSSPSAYSTGEPIPIGDLPRLGRPVPSAGRNIISGSLNGETELHLLPITVSGSACVAGRAVSQRWVPDVDGLNAFIQAGILAADWTWPAGVRVVSVVLRLDQYPDGPNDSEASQCIRCTIEQYQANRGLRLTAPPAEKLFLTVYGAINRSGSWEFARGASAGCRREVAVRTQRTARYWVESRRKWLRATGEYELYISLDAAVDLPELMLLGKPDGLPVSPTDGVVILRIPRVPTAGPDRPLCFPFTPPWPVSICNVRLFPVSDEDADWLELLGSK